MKNMQNTQEHYDYLKKYFVSRSDKDFWKVFDWFNEYKMQRDPINAGLYDLNRYARTVWEKK